ncbi:MAG: hypothetical protein SFY66_04915 [Oculatellaceae cyanobacterium bins.114]|nr:hypothetical protein [Oculatellaceae cyanobacterium bins.114]
MQPLSRLAKFGLRLAFLAVLTFLLVGWLHSDVAAQEPPPPLNHSLPPLQVYPLPATLAQWRDDSNQGSYFLEVRPTEVGYLIWSQFPVRIFIEPAEAVSDALDGVRGHASQLPRRDRDQDWVDAVTRAVGEWNAYLPLMIVESSDIADINIWRRSPPLQHNNGTLRARSAETRYTLYIQRSDSTPPTLVHRFSILLRPSQTTDYIQAAARHELGHALGIWGHSPVQTDALYFSQVRNPPAISIRDVNTLKQVYEQPTRLGWQVGE